MPGVWTLTILSVGAISLISLIGALTLALTAARKHLILLALVAFAAGALLGDSFFHLLPESVEIWQEITPKFGAVILAGFVAFYIFETGLRWGHGHGESAHPHQDVNHDVAIAPFAWTNLVGDGIHNFLDGVLVGAAYLADVNLGVATTIAVAAHEIPQELGDFAVLLQAGMSVPRALLYNLGSALLAVLGALLILAAPLDQGTLEYYALPLTIGGFVYIAAADLIPELHHHSKMRHVPIILLGFFVGLAAMGALLLVEVG